MSDSPSKLTGTQWHVGYIKMKPGDHKRDKRNCVYYGKDKNSCGKKYEHCIGSSHCKYYKEVQKAKTEIKQEAKPIHNNPRTPKELVSIECTIPLAEYIKTKNGKMGLFVKYKNKTMTLLVNGKEVGYVYPNAFEQGYLIATPEIEKCIKNDKDKAVWK